MKKVCMIVHEYYPKDFRVRREAEALIENGYKVDVICLKKSDEKFEDKWKKVKIHRLPVKRHRGSPLIIYILEYFNFFFFAFFKLLHLYIQNKFDIIHVHNPPDFLVFVTIIPKFFGAKIIIDIHDRVPILYLSRFGLHKNHPLIYLISFVEKMAINFANKLIVSVDIHKKMFAEMKIPTNKIKVVLNAADENYFYPRQLKSIKKNEKLKLFHHGTLLERYGRDIIIEAASLLKKKSINFSL